jgi:phosphate transport system substrate-binding protein
MFKSPMSRVALLATLVGTAALFAPEAEALKYAKREHNINADPSLPVWVPGPVTVEPEEELNIVGADIMDEMTLGWAKMMRRAYPRLSVTMEARASGSGGPGLTEGRSHLAPGRRSRVRRKVRLQAHRNSRCNG